MIDKKEVILLQEMVSSSGDQHAFMRLYRLYFSSLLQFAVSFLRSRPVSEEIVSDVFLHLWQKRASLGSIHNLTVYLYTCIRNHCLNHLAKQKREHIYWFDEESFSIPSEGLDPEQLFITLELAKEIDAVVRRLPPKCRMIFKLIREDGLKYREAAKVLDISVKTVEAQMGIAVKRIHEAIRPDIKAYAEPFRFRSSGR
ncbi:MAG: RNA polymerase sigma-70 factor [Chitinophagaceae bacterium]|nr:RNA polymerase sigma-70 factor [Chitinophagaceae bacterium]